MLEFGDAIPVPGPAIRPVARAGGWYHDARMDPAALLAGRTRETTIVRDAEGRWFHDGQPLSHPSLSRAFDSWVERAEDGRFCLRNDINWAYITLQGPAHFVRSVELRDDGAWLQLSNGKRERLDPDTLRQDARGQLFCDVQGGQMVAGFDRHAASGLAEVLSEDADGVYVAIGGQRYRPPVVDDPLQPLKP